MLRAQLLDNHDHEGQAVVSSKNLSGAVHVRVLPISYADYQAGERACKSEGAMVQDVFPALSASDREFLINGMTPADSYAVFGLLGDEEEKDENLQDLCEEGAFYLTPEQYQLVYAGEKSLEDVYAYNRRQIEERLQEQTAQPSV